jgi:hypothetical protein
MPFRISVLLAVAALSLGVAATSASPAQSLPKLKYPGNILVDYAAAKNPPADGLVAQWKTGLSFKNTNQVHAAVCVYDPAHEDYRVGGLHLTGNAARQLATDLLHMAGTHATGGVEIVNHRNHRRNIWWMLRPRDAKVLSGQLTQAARGHATS